MGEHRHILVGVLTAPAMSVAFTCLLVSGRQLRSVPIFNLLCVGLGLFYLLLASPNLRSRMLLAAHFVLYGMLPFIAAELALVRSVLRWEAVYEES